MTSLQPYMDWEGSSPSILADIEVDEEESNSTAEEIWHVAISWDDIKTMSLEQLDDAFRLDVIAADTPVWKEGMSGWQPLSVVAGMDDDDDMDGISEEETVLRSVPMPARTAKAAPPRAPGPPPRAPSPPPRAPSRAPVAPTRSLSAPPLANAARAANFPPPRASVAPSAPSRAPAAPSRAPAAPSRASVAHAAPSRAPVASAAPMRNSLPRNVDPFRAPPAPHASTQPRMAAVQPSQAPRQANPASLPPGADLAFARSMVPPASQSRPRPIARRSGRQAWFFVPLAIAGGLFAAYRNDLLLDAARTLHQEERYLQAERALLGDPGFGTPRSVAASAALTGSTDDESAKAERATQEEETPTEAPAVTALAKPKAEEPPPEAVAPTRVAPPPPAVAQPAPAVAAHPIAAPERPAPKAVAPAPAPQRAIAAAPVARVAPPAPPAAPTRALPSTTKHDDVKAAKIVLSETDDDSAPALAPRKATAASKAAAKASAKAAASFGSVGRDEEKPAATAPKPEPKPKPAPPPKAAPPPPMPEPSSGNSALDDAIKAAVKKHAPAKKKGPNAEYDPLNSDL